MPFFLEYVMDAFRDHSQVDVIYTDFAKSFDHVNHHALITILKLVGFGVPMISWFRSYLSNRIQM